ncbi:unnamed protein product [Ectocarpus sp. 12 AP-2014]
MKRCIARYKRCHRHRWCTPPNCSSLMHLLVVRVSGPRTARWLHLFFIRWPTCWNWKQVFRGQIVLFRSHSGNGEEKQDTGNPGLYVQSLVGGVCCNGGLNGR